MEFKPPSTSRDSEDDQVGTNPPSHGGAPPVVPNQTQETLIQGAVIVEQTSKSQDHVPGSSQYSFQSRPFVPDLDPTFHIPGQQRPTNDPTSSNSSMNRDFSKMLQTSQIAENRDELEDLLSPRNKTGKPLITEEIDPDAKRKHEFSDDEDEQIDESGMDVYMKMINGGSQDEHHRHIPIKIVANIYQGRPYEKNPTQLFKSSQVVEIEEAPIKPVLSEYSIQYRSQHGPFQNPMTKFTADEIGDRKWVGNTQKHQVVKLFSYPYPACSVGMVMSFKKITKAKEKAIGIDGCVLPGVFKTIKVPGICLTTIRLDTYVCFSLNPQPILNQIEYLVNNPEALDILKLPADYELPAKYKHSDKQLNLQYVKEEVMYLRDWLQDDVAQSQLYEFNSFLYGEHRVSCIKNRKDEDPVQKREKLKTTKEVAKQVQGMSTKAMKRFEKTQDQIVVDEDASSVSSTITRYKCRKYFPTPIPKSLFLTCENEKQYHDFWELHSLEQDGKLREVCTNLMYRSQIMRGLDHHRYCYSNGMIEYRERLPKDLLKKMLIKIKMINMNYCGFNVNAIFKHNIKDMESLLRLQLQFEEQHHKGLIEVYGETLVVEEHPVRINNIDMLRVNFAIDMVKYYESKKPQQEVVNENLAKVDEIDADATEQAKERAKWINFHKVRAGEEMWQIIPPLRDQIRQVALMFNTLYDFEIFHDKLFTFQMLCFMTKSDPKHLFDKLKNNYFDLDKCIAFNSDWSFYKFKKDYHVDVNFGNPELKKKPKSKSKEPVGEEDQANKKEQRPQSQKANADQEMDDVNNKKKSAGVNPYLAQFQQFQKEQKKKQQQEEEEAAKQKKQEEGKEEEVPIPESVKYDLPKKGWHVFHYIKKQYKKNNLGPFIVQLDRHDTHRKDKFSEYVVIKSLQGSKLMCVVFNAGGPQAIDLRDMQGEYDSPIEGLTYNFQLKSFRDTYNINNIAFDKQALIQSYYTTCTIYSLALIEQAEVSNERHKFKSMVDLIQTFAGAKKFNEVYFKEKLIQLKNNLAKADIDLVHDTDYVSLNNIVKGRIAENRNPLAAMAASKMYPGIFDDTNDTNLSQDQIQLKKEAKQAMHINRLLHKHNLLNGTGGITLEYAGLEGLLELKYDTYLQHQALCAQITEHRTLEIQAKKSNIHESGLQGAVLQQKLKQYLEDRLLMFALNGIAFALIYYVVMGNLYGSAFDKNTLRCKEELIKLCRNKVEIYQEMPAIAKRYLTKKEKLRYENIKRHQRKRQDQEDTKMDEAYASRNEEFVDSKLKDYLAYVNLVRRDAKFGIDGSHLKDSFKFFVWQVTSDVALRRLIRQFANFNPSWRGTIASGILQRKIHEHYKEELALKNINEIQARGDEEYECIMYDPKGHLLYDKKGNGELDPRTLTSNYKGFLTTWMMSQEAGIPVEFFKGEPNYSISLQILANYGYNKDALISNQKRKSLKIDEDDQDRIQMIKGTREYDFNTRRDQSDSDGGIQDMSSQDSLNEDEDVSKGIENSCKSSVSRPRNVSITPQKGKWGDHERKPRSKSRSRSLDSKRKKEKQRGRGRSNSRSSSEGSVSSSSSSSSGSKYSRSKRSPQRSHHSKQGHSSQRDSQYGGRGGAYYGNSSRYQDKKSGKNNKKHHRKSKKDKR